MFLEYVKRRSPIVQGIDGRVSFTTDSDHTCNKSAGKLTQMNYIIGLIVAHLMFYQLA